MNSFCPLAPAGGVTLQPRWQPSCFRCPRARSLPQGWRCSSTWMERGPPCCLSGWQQMPGNAALEQDLLEIQGTNLKFPCSHHMNKARKCWHDFTVCQTHILFSLKCKRCACSPAQSVRIMKSRCRSSFKGCCFGITDRLGCLKSAPKLTLKNPYFKYGFIRVKYGLNTGYVRVWENRVFAQNQVFKI